MFYNLGFVVAEGNASAREMRKKSYPLDRWFDLLFRHDGDVSRVDLKGAAGLTAFLRIARAVGTIINGRLLNMMRLLVTSRSKLSEIPMVDKTEEALSSQYIWIIKILLALRQLYCMSSSGRRVQYSNDWTKP